MTPLSFLGILLLLPSPPAHAFLFGGGNEADRVALLWAPVTKSVDWVRLRGILEEHDAARWTLAVAPEEVPAQAQTWLAEAAAAGRIELALRLAGDPVLPMLHRVRARDPLDRLALGRVAFRQAFGRDPEGLVPGDGALSPELARSLKVLKFRWAAIGGVDDPWLAEEAVVLVPFSRADAEPGQAEDESSAASAPRALVMSEADAPQDCGLSALLARMEGGAKRWNSVAGSLAHRQTQTPPAGPWPTWDGELADWEEHPLQRRAWELYARAAKAVEAYKNSGSASLASLKGATAALYAAQDSAYYRLEGLSKPSVERAFRSRLQQVYRRLGRPAPALLASSLSAGLGKGELSLPEESEPRGATPLGTGPQGAEPAAGANPEEEASPETDAPGGIDGEAGEDRLRFSSPAGTEAAAPAPPPQLPRGTTAQDLWTPLNLAAAWTEDAVTFTFGLKRVLNQGGTPYGIDHAMIELYIDMNHLTGRGANSLLPGRRAFLRAADAWEYALVVNGHHAGLYRPAAGRPAELVARLDPQADARAGQVRVSVPRRWLRGSPSAWGYLFVTTATDGERAQRVPPEALPGAAGHPVLGLLGTLADQKLLREAKSGYHRLPAVRLESETAP